ncbi:MAG TPA: hypothetical protein VG326_02190 [Tepidisphaeraceae bacterium]|nr:hypothetical protein [Tepidisphaeraceae bacterium]
MTKLLRIIGLSTFCVLLAGAMERPRIFPLDGASISGGDLGQMIWNLWVVNENVKNGVTPFETDLIYYPTGANLTHHSLAGGFLPLTFLVDAATDHGPMYPFIAYHLGLWACFALLLFFMYLFLKEIGFSAMPSALAAVGNSFFCFYGRNLHLTLLSGFIIPMNALFAVRWFRNPTRWRTVAFACSLAISLYFSEFVVWCLLAMAVMTAAICLWPTQRRAFVARLGKMGLLGFLLALASALAIAQPYLVEFALAPAVIKPNPIEHEICSADLLALVTPTHDFAGDPLTPLYGGLFHSINARLWSRAASCEVFIGFPMLLLAAIGLSRLRLRAGWLWMAVLLSLFFYVIVMGPRLHVMGHRLMWMPYSVLMKAPLFSLQRTPSRSVVMAMFFLAVVAAAGAEQILDRFRGARGRGIGMVILAVIGVWIIAECYRPHEPLPSYRPPPALAEVGPGAAPVANLPLFDGGDGYAQQLQIFHHRPSLVGYLARQTIAMREDEQVLQNDFMCGPQIYSYKLRRRNVDTVLIYPLLSSRRGFNPTRSFVADMAEIVPPLKLIDLRDFKSVLSAEFGTHRLTNGYVADAPGTTILEPGKELVYRRTASISGARIEILAAPPEEVFEVTLSLKGANVPFVQPSLQRIDRHLTTEPVDVVGLQWRSLDFQTCRFDAIEIHPTSGHRCSVARVTVWDR